MPKKAATTKKGPRVMRIMPTRVIAAGSASPVGSAVATDGAAAKGRAQKPDVEDFEIDLSRLQIKDDIVQIPISKITADIPVIPFRRNKRKWGKTLPFLELPSEIRIKIYEYYFADSDDTLDLNPENYKRYHKLLGLMRTCRQISDEATHLFYSTHAFRVFPIHPARLKTKKPILARLKPRQKHCIKVLDMRLGPGWSAPPKCWFVSDRLGLKDCVNATRLNVFVQCDPSDNIFKGFRRPDSFYEVFCQQLLSDVIEAMPALRTIQFDGWSPVKKTGGMMSRLLQVVENAGLVITWGPERGWTDSMEEPDVQAVPTAADLELLDFLAQNGSYTPSNAVAVA